MGMFKQVEGENAIVVENGVFKQTDLYARDGYLYAKTGAGFVRLYADGSTSKAKCRIDVMTFEKALFVDKLGRLCDASVDGAKGLDAPKAQLLLGAVP